MVRAALPELLRDRDPARTYVWIATDTATATTRSLSAYVRKELVGAEAAGECVGVLAGELSRRAWASDSGDHRGMDVTLHLAQQPEADELLGRSPLAALVGMLLDQQIPMEWAFAGPYAIAQRLGTDDLDAHEIAAYAPEVFASLLSAKPAVHRYPGSMAKRIQQLCQYLVEHYDGDAAVVWEGVETGDELLRRLKELPGFGVQKAQIFLALLGKQLGVRPQGWREAAGAYGEAESFRSVADITGPESLTKVRAHKQEMKAAAKAAKTAKASGK